MSESRLVWKQDVRILPLWTVILFLYYLQRANLGHAVLVGAGDGAHGIAAETGLTTRHFQIAQTAFYLAAIVFAVPSNMLLKKLRPARWMALSMFAWGVVSMCTSVAADGAAVAGLRFLQGAFQAGVLPGLPFHLTFWYRVPERGTRLALLFAVAVLAAAFGPAVAQALADNMARAQGIAAWRWLFLVEGVPTCAVALAVLFALPDFPETAAWLSPGEKELAMRRLFVDGSKRYEPAAARPAFATLRDGRLYGHYLVFLGVSCALASLPLFAPALDAARGFAGMPARLQAVPPYAAAAVVAVAAGRAGDRLNARALVAAGLATAAAAAFLAAALVAGDAHGARYACLVVAAGGSLGCVPLLLAWLANNVADTPAVGLALALNAGLGGGLGDMVATWAYKADEAGRGFPTGHWVNAVLLLSVAAGCVLLRLHYHERNHRMRMETGGHEAVRFFSY